ncbi:MAG: putative membrane protein (DUF2078) [Rhodobacteraceae bacterium HLUCCA12]|nr:MAG: putative membrane protein (DUF2078) [Rhodobacteraceae bacterium HLUCCA12]
MKTLVFLNDEGKPRRLIQGRLHEHDATGAIEADLPRDVSILDVAIVDGVPTYMPRQEAPPPVIVHDRAKGSDKEAVRIRRQRQFRQESDQLIGPLLRGEITAEEFQAVADRIRAENPYPEPTDETTEPTEVTGD